MKGKYQYNSLVFSQYSHNDEPSDTISNKLRPSSDIILRRKTILKSTLCFNIQEKQTGWLKNGLGVNV